MSVRTVLKSRIALLVASVLAVTVGVGTMQEIQSAEAVTACSKPSAGVFRSSPAHSPKAVALTFDDGPGPFTAQIVAVLKAKGVRGTFFETGSHVAANPALSRLVVVNGNLIGNHTYDHPQYTIPGMKAFDLMTAAAQISELDKTTTAIRNATAQTPCFFRGPGGHQFGATTQSLVKARKMWNIYWSQTTGDSAQPAFYSTSSINTYVAKATTGRINANHPIILMHDGEATPRQNPNKYRGNTVAALPRIIDWYKARGYVFTDPAGHKFTGSVPSMTVTATLTSPSSVRANQVYTVSGTTKGAAYGSVVTAQKYSSGRWINLGTTAVKMTGSYSRAFSSKTKGMLTLRVVVGGRASNTAVTRIV